MGMDINIPLLSEMQTRKVPSLFILSLGLIRDDGVC